MEMIANNHILFLQYQIGYQGPQVELPDKTDKMVGGAISSLREMLIEKKHAKLLIFKI